MGGIDENGIYAFYGSNRPVSGGLNEGTEKEQTIQRFKMRSVIGGLPITRSPEMMRGYQRGRKIMVLNVP